MTLDPKRDPARRCMPVGQWPAPDRLAWDAALAAGDLLDGSGPAAHWRPDTRKKVASSYGRFLTFLHRQGLLDPGARPAARVTRDILKAYTEELRAQVCSVSLAQRVTELHEALRVMAPEAEIGFINRASRRLWAATKASRDKRSRVVHPNELLALGIRLMDEAEAAVFRRRDSRPCRYRDGLMIAVLACRPIRRSNFAEMRIGRHLIRSTSGYLISLEGKETKNHGPNEYRLPDLLTPYIERYIATYRPLLLKGNAIDRLWVSLLGRPMAHGAIYDRIMAATTAAFGRGVNLHLFRDCQATFQAIEDPRHVGIVPLLLGQTDARTSERYYNQASTAEAAKRYQEDILSLRREMCRPSRRRRKT